MPRRKEPELKPRADGRYACRYKDRFFYGDTAAEAAKLRDEYKYRCEHGIEEIRNITVSDYAAEWLPIAKASVSDKCYNDYAVQLEALTAVCGDKYMNAVVPNDILKVWQHYLGYSESTIHRARMLYRSMFASAIENGYCRSNPVEKDSAKPHKGTVGTHRAIESWERELILSTPHRMQGPAMLMLYAGLRRGEMLAFSGEDLVNDHVCVNHAIRFESNRPVLSDPKTEAGYREIPVFDALRPFVENLQGLILPGEYGDYCSETVFKNAWEDWKNTIERKMNHCHTQKRWYMIEASYRDLDPHRYDQIQRLLRRGKKEEADAVRFMGWREWTVRPHDLRHSFCVMLRDAGVDMKLAMQWMGHADEKMILHVYDHVSDLRIQSAIQSVNQMNRPDPGEVPLRVVSPKKNPRRKAQG